MSSRLIQLSFVFCIIFGLKCTIGVHSIKPPNLAPYFELSDGNFVPALGFGTSSIPRELAQEVVTYAIVQQGYRHIDSAYIYGNEKEIGQALANIFRTTNLTRDDIFITSKVWNSYHSRERVTEGCHKSLQNLGINYFDLYLIHWPIGLEEGGDDIPTNADGTIRYSNVDYVETWQGMEDVYNNGLAKSIGLSNFNSIQIDRILSNCTIRPVMNQVECHPYLNQEKLLEFCKGHNIMLTAYAPLGSPGYRRRVPGQPNLLNDSIMKRIAKRHSKTVAQVMLRFQYQRGIVAIPKSVTPSRIEENISIFDFELSDQEMKTILSLNKNYRLFDVGNPSHPHYPFSALY